VSALKTETATLRVWMLAMATYQLSAQRFPTSVAELSIIRKFSLAMRTFHGNVPPVPEIVNIVYNRRLQKSRMKFLSVNNRVGFITKISK
jgi:hypothetical protein